MTDILDMTAVNEAKDTMKAKFPTMVQYFMEDAEAYIRSIREGISLASAEKIISPAHTLKSSSRQMGAMRMSTIAKAMEALAREQCNTGKIDMEPLAEMLVKLEAAFVQTKDAYKQHAA